MEGLIMGRDMNIYHNSHRNIYRNPFGAVEAGKKVEIFIEGEEGISVYVILKRDNNLREEIVMKRKKHGFVTTIDTENTIGIIEYSFKIVDKDKVFYYGNNEEELGGDGKVYYDKPIPYTITVYKIFSTPNWFKEGIVYHIFVDSFNRGKDFNLIDKKRNILIYGSSKDKPFYIKNNKGEIVRWNFYGGTLKGIGEKLKYIRSLGFTVIYLSPIFKASSPHRYDTGDYKKIDDILGCEEDFVDLCREAEVNGIKIVLDGVFSHTGADSIYFNKYGNFTTKGAYSSNNSPYYSWYTFKDSKDNYECWWGDKNLPNVRELEPSYMDFIIRDKDSVINKWMNLGTAGWRLDVADELPDEFIKELRIRIKENKRDGVLIGEVWEDASRKISYGVKRKYVLGEELDSVTNYVFRDMVIDFLTYNIDSYKFYRKSLSLKENYPEEFFSSLLNVIGSHDTERILTVFKNYNENNFRELLKLSSVIQLTFKGVPCVYYGDEVGLQGGLDPDNRRYYPFGEEDIEILDHYKKLLKIRNEYEVLRNGKIEFEDFNEDVLIIKRSFNNKKIYIIINRSSKDSYSMDILLELRELYSKGVLSYMKNSIGPLGFYIGEEK